MPYYRLTILRTDELRGDQFASSTTETCLHGMALHLRPGVRLEQWRLNNKHSTKAWTQCQLNSHDAELASS